MRYDQIGQELLAALSQSTREVNEVMSMVAQQEPRVDEKEAPIDALDTLDGLFRALRNRTGALEAATRELHAHLSADNTDGGATKET